MPLGQRREDRILLSEWQQVFTEIYLIIFVGCNFNLFLSFQNILTFMTLSKNLLYTLLLYDCCVLVTSHEIVFAHLVPISGKKILGKTRTKT
jgi:hypothetical protein